jgi:hypothetical protein
MGNLGFTVPGVLFLSSATAPEFRGLKTMIAGAREAGYERFVEPACGAMAMCHLARQIGWPANKIEASDVMFFSTAVGYAAMGKRLDEIEPQAEGFENEDLGDPATAIWAHAVSRAESKLHILYWQEIARSLRERKEEHLDGLRQQLARANEVMDGVKYTSEDLFDHLERVVDDPKTLIVLNPPSSTGGYERFYKTAVEFKWKEPSFDMFEVVQGYNRLTKMMEQSKALWSVYFENQGGFEPPGAVFVRSGGRKAPGDSFVKSVNYYICSNRPEEFMEYSGGAYAIAWKGQTMEPLRTPVMPADYPVTVDSSIVVGKLSTSNALYYRSLWTHNFVGNAANLNLGLFVDGYLCGVLGYDPQYLRSSGAFGRDDNMVLLVYGMTAPSDGRRINRLLSKVALSRDTLLLAMSDVEMYRCAGVRTANFTKYPEAKENRGLMTLTDRKPHPTHGYRLIYEAPISEDTWAEALQWWINTESRRTK